MIDLFISQVYKCQKKIVFFLYFVRILSMNKQIGLVIIEFLELQKKTLITNVQKEICLLCSVRFSVFCNRQSFQNLNILLLLILLPIIFTFKPVICILTAFISDILISYVVKYYFSCSPNQEFNSSPNNLLQVLFQSAFICIITVFINF